MSDSSKGRFDLSAKKRALMELLLRQRGVESVPPDRIERASNRSRAPLSYAQERLWFLDQLEPGSANYNMAAAFRLVGRL